MPDVTTRNPGAPATANEPPRRDRKPTYLRVTLDTDERIVGEFARLVNVQRYASQVFAGVKPFNVYRTISRVHPASGVPCLIRERVMLNGKRVTQIEDVVPIDTYATDIAAGDLNPNYFVAKPIIDRGAHGLWTAPAGIDGAIEGMQYPIERDPVTLERFVILRPQTDADGAPVRHLLDAGATGPGDGDDDISPSERATLVRSAEQSGAETGDDEVDDFSDDDDDDE